MPWSRRAKTNAENVAGTAAGAVIGGTAGALGVGLLSKAATAGSGLFASGLQGAATATTSITSALIATAPVIFPLAGVLVGGLGAYAIMKNLKS
jgi:uncharacterized protein YcfJ